MISKETIKKTWQKIDDLVNWNKIAGNVTGSILEIADNVAGPMLLNAINEKAISKLPEDIHDNIERALEAWVIDDYEAVLDELPETVDELINIKQLSPETESALSLAIFKAGVEFVQYYSKKQVESKDSQPLPPGQ